MVTKFRLTVPKDFYDAVHERCGEEFADSYLTGATLSGGKLTPRTVTAFLKMMDRTDFRRLIAHLNIALVRPEPWPGDGTRLSHPTVY